MVGSMPGACGNQPLTKWTTRLPIGLGFAVALLGAVAADAHVTYNLAGYGSNLGGSTNGADGLPSSGVSASFTDGPVDGYTSGLPLQWYCGLHTATQVHTIQTGSGANPPLDSLLASVNAYNAANDPDLPTDRVLGLGGLSWADPSNDGQGWGHGMDYGLIEITPLDTITAGGPVRLTITLADDSSDGVSVQLAYALYGGWDTNPNSSRHQTFVSSPAPVDNPLGSTGLTLIDYAVAGAHGQTLSRTYAVDATYGGKYTILVAALDGVAGQYQLTAGLYPGPQLSQEELEQCTAALDDATTQLAAKTADADGDQVPDVADACPQTAAGQFVDAVGCSQAQFCARYPVGSKSERRICKAADWKNDETVMKPKDADCAFVKGQTVCSPVP